jgi:hypothetical protein
MSFNHLSLSNLIVFVTCFSKGRICRKSNQNVSIQNDDGNVRFEVFTAVTMKNGVSWDVTLCGSCKILRIGGA